MYDVPPHFLGVFGDGRSGWAKPRGRPAGNTYVQFQLAALERSHVENHPPEFSLERGGYREPVPVIVGQDFVCGCNRILSRIYD